jgi:hypothetical protein
VAAPDPYIINYDPTRGAWSRGVRLLDEPSLERGFSGAFGADGRLRLAYCKVAVGEDAEGVPTFGAVDLCVLDHPVGPDPAIGVAGVGLSTNAAEVGESVDILVAVENRGELTVTNLAVCVYAGNPVAGGMLIGVTQRLSEVIGGATATVTVAWTVPAATNNIALYAVVDPGLETDDRNPANNTATLVALVPDLAVRGASVQTEAPTVRLLTATVVNEGSAPVPAGTVVTFRRGATDGALLAQESLQYMAVGSNGAYEAGFRWDMAGGVYTSAFEMVYVAATGSVQEIETRNNRVALQVMTTLDTDGDGLLDGEELQLGTSVSSSDTDRDGVPDAAEVRTHGTDPLRADTDGDGSPDGHELDAGTDPLSATDVFKIVTASGTTNYVMAVTWNAKSGTTYRVDMTSDLNGDWTNAPNGAAAEEQNQRTAVSNGVLRYLDPSPGPTTNRFYRVQKMP